MYVISPLSHSASTSGWVSVRRCSAAGASRAVSSRNVRAVATPSIVVVMSALLGRGGPGPAANAPGPVGAEATPLAHADGAPHLHG